MSDQPTPVKINRLVLTSVNQVLVLVKTHPELATRIPKLAPLLNASPSTAPKKSCNCGSRQNITTPDANKQVAENLLSSLTDADFLDIKNILGASELCYYTRDTAQNSLQLRCV